MTENNTLVWDQKAVRLLRLRLGWSRAEMAHKLACSAADIEQLEEGVIAIDFKLRSELEILHNQAEANSEEIMARPAAENSLAQNALSQIDFSRIKAELE